MEGAMLHTSQAVACTVSSHDRSSPYSSNETLVQLLAKAITTFDSDRETAKTFFGISSGPAFNHANANIRSLIEK
jgi:hypothetical protein